MTEQYYAVFNAFLYIFLFYTYWMKEKRMTPGIYVISIWGFCGVSGALYETVNWFGHYWEITLWPYIYLFICNFLLFLPILLFKDKLIKTIHLNEKLLYVGAAVLGILSIPPFIESMIYYASVYNNSQLMLEAFTERYQDAEKTYYYLSTLSRRLTYILHATRTFCLFAFFYLPTIPSKPKSYKYVYAGLCLSILLIPLEALCLLARFQIVAYSMYGIFIFLTIKNLYSSKQMINIRKYSIIGGGLFACMLLLQTASRYMNYTENMNRENVGIIAYLGQYSGESMGNFNGNIVHSNHYFGVDPILKKYAGLIGIDIMESHYTESRFATNQFFTGVGELWRAYGGIAAFIIVVISSMVMCKYIKNMSSKSPSILSLLIFYLFSKFSIIGIFYHAYFIDSDELIIIPLVGIILYKNGKTKALYAK